MKRESRLLSRNDSGGERAYDVHSCADNQSHGYARMLQKVGKKKWELWRRKKEY